MQRNRQAPPLRLLTVSLLAATTLPAVAAAQALLTDHSPEVFLDRTQEAGLDFVYDNGMTGKYYMPEIIGAGGALFDYDNDGDLDLYLIQGRLLGSETIEEDRERPAGLLRDRLFRNDLLGLESSGKLEFTEVSLGELAEGQGYAVGVASGDYDNDGWTDLYVTALGPNRLLRNRGDGSFEDVTHAAGAQDLRWSVSSVFFDFDRDGWLDLFVGNYVDYSIETNTECRTEAGPLDYCGPRFYPSAPDSLWRNSGDGTFEEVSVRAGIRSAYGSALGVLSADFDGDGWQDLYVANDGVPNQLWMNQGDGTFRDEALLRGTAVNSLGRPEGSMGVTAGDFDGDGDLDIFLTHLEKETNTLYRNEDIGFFDDTTTLARLGTPSLPYTGFGTAFLDYDNDGWLDLAVVNGAVDIPADADVAEGDFPLEQPNQLFHNTRNGRFEETSASAGISFRRSEVSRGLLVGDLDNDGDADLVIVNNGSPTRLLINEVGHQSHWLGLRLVAGEGLRDDLGAWVAVHRKGSHVLWRQVTTAGSYGSASDPRLLFGLGGDPRIERVVVLWTDGLREEWQVNADRYAVLTKGRGRALGTLDLSGTLTDLSSGDTRHEPTSYTVAPDRRLPIGDSSTPLIFGDLREDRIHPVRDLDLFTFTGTTGGLIVVQIAATSGSGNPCFEILRPDASLLASQCEFNNPRVDITLDQTGTHTILAFDKNDDETFSYSILVDTITPLSCSARHIEFDCTLELEPQQLLQNTTFLKSHRPLCPQEKIPMEDLIDPVGDLDIDSFFGMSGDLILLTTLAVSGPGSPCIELLGPDGSLIGADCHFDKAVLNETLSQTGIHTILISDDNDDETLAYDVHIQCIGRCQESETSCVGSLSVDLQSGDPSAGGATRP